MLSCSQFAHRHASDYIDDQLQWRDRVGVRLHLLLCDNCRRFVAQLRQVRAVLRRRTPKESLSDNAAVTDLAARLATIYDARKNNAPPL